MSENNSNTLGVMFAFLLGGLIGAGLALLYAPSSGEETRKRLKEQMAKQGDELNEIYESAVDTVEEGMGKVKEAIEEKKSAVINAYEAGRDAYKKERGKLSKESA